MKLTSESKIESPTLEKLEIHIEFDPSNPTEEGYAALIATVVDLVNRNKMLAEALDELEKQP